MEKLEHRRANRTGDDILNEIMGDRPDAQLLFVGSVNCLRHRPYLGIGTWMQQGRASILCPSMTDFSTGRYLRQIKQAVAELARERNASLFFLMFGCQWVILSTDGELLRQELLEECGVEVRFHDSSHMEHGDR